MKSLQPKMIRYSEKNGYTVEFREPGSVYLDFDEAFMATVIFEGIPDDKELETNFTRGERAIIQRFIDLWVEEMERLSEQYANIDSADLFVRKVKRFLSLWLSTETKETRSQIESVFGWQYIETTESRMDRAVREKLKETWQTKEDFEKILCQKPWGQVNPQLMKELEERYGKFDLDAS